MEDKNRKLEELLQTPCYSIDFLPQPIPPAALSQFRTIQHHLLNALFFSCLRPVGRLEGTAQPIFD